MWWYWYILLDIPHLEQGIIGQLSKVFDGFCDKWIIFALFMWLEQWHVKPDYPFLNSGGFFNYLYHCTIVNCNLFWTLSLLSVHCNTGIPLLHPHDCLQTAAANSQQVDSNHMCQKYLSTFTTATSTINTAPPSCFTCITFYIASIILLPFIRLLVTGIGDPILFLCCLLSVT